MGKYKRLSWLLAVLVVLVFVLWSNYRKQTISSITSSPSPSPSVDFSPIVKAKFRANKNQKNSGPTLSYQEALGLYGDWRVQFDSSCRALPAHLVVKTGSKIMFDNRTSDAKAVNIDGKIHTFPGYGFQIITLASQNPFHEFNLDCQSISNQSENTNTILVQQ